VGHDENGNKRAADYGTWDELLRGIHIVIMSFFLSQIVPLIRFSSFLHKA
jgi:hypothetical protein